MTAVYTVVTPYDGIDSVPFAVVADDSTATYVYRDGEEIDGLDAGRIEALLQLHDAPTTVAGWLTFGTYNVGYVYTTAPVAAPDLASATTAAQQALAALPK